MQACSATIGDQFFVFGGMEPPDVDSDEDEDDFMPAENMCLWSFSTVRNEWEVRWAKQPGMGRFSVGPSDWTSDGAALLPWRSEGESFLILYAPNAASNYLHRDPDGDVSEDWPNMRLDTRDMPWIFVLRTGLWQRLRTCGPLNQHGVPTGGETTRGPSGFFAGKQLDDVGRDRGEPAHYRRRHCTGAATLLAGEGGAPTRLFVWGGVYWSADEASAKPDTAQTALFQLTISGDAARFAQSPDGQVRVNARSHSGELGPMQITDEVGSVEWFDAETGLRKEGCGPQDVELTCGWTRLKQTGELPSVRQHHTLSAVAGHLVLLGGDAVGDDYSEHHQGHAVVSSSDPDYAVGGPLLQEPLGLRTYCLETGSWSSVTGGLPPISNHTAFALPRSKAVDWQAQTLRQDYNVFSLACNRLSEHGALPHISQEVRRHVFSAMAGEDWSLRSSGRLLVVRRSDDIYRHDPPPEDTAVMMYDFFTASWHTLARARPTDEGWAGGIPGGLQPFGLLEPMNVGLVECETRNYGWPELRLLLHVGSGDRNGNAVVLSGAIPGGQARHQVAATPNLDTAAATAAAAAPGASPAAAAAAAEPSRAAEKEMERLMSMQLRGPGWPAGGGAKSAEPEPEY